MKTTSSQIETALASIKAPVPHGSLPVLFAGPQGPRYIGNAETHDDADTLAVMNRLSATYNSTATVIQADGSTSREFFLLHG